MIDRSFFERDTLTVAKDLIGKCLVTVSPAGTASGIIVETEAYLGAIDDAAHSYKGKTERVAVQYGEKGLCYVYLIYGMYCCFNITTGPKGVPEVVLIRALEPADGIELMERRRNTDKVLNLCSGPGKLCQAMGIDRQLNGADLCGRRIYLEDRGIKYNIEASKRINIDYATMCRDKLWRFTAAGSKYISRK